MNIDEIEKQARELNLTGLYLAINRAIYANVKLKNEESGNCISDAACIKNATARFERAWNLVERMPVARASTDVLLVQVLKDEIATAMVSKLVK